MPEATISKLIRDACMKWSDRKPAMRHKKYGIWNPYTWKHLWERTKYFGLGMMSLGYKPGDCITIVGNNEPEWYYAEFASICCGGLSTGVRQEASAEEILHVIKQSGSNFVVAEDQEQVDKLLALKSQMPETIKIIYWDSKGMKPYADPVLMPFDNIVRLGEEYDKSFPNLFDQVIDQRNPDDPVLLIYPFGSSGFSDGILLSSLSSIAAGDDWDSSSPTRENDHFMSAFSLADGSEFLFLVPAWLKAGACLNFPEESATTSEN